LKHPAKKNYDGNRQRCISCGHPRREHRAAGCTVPKCKCVQYTSADVVVSADEPAR